MSPLHTLCPLCPEILWLLLMTKIACRQGDLGNIGLAIRSHLATGEIASGRVLGTGLRGGAASGHVLAVEWMGTA